MREAVERPPLLVCDLEEMETDMVMSAGKRDFDPNDWTEEERAEYEKVKAEEVKGAKSKKTIAEEVREGIVSGLKEVNKKKKEKPKVNPKVLAMLAVDIDPRATPYERTKQAITLLGVKFRYDLFHRKVVVEGDVPVPSGTLEIQMIPVRDAIVERFGFDPGQGTLWDAMRAVSVRNRFNPITDYLNGLEWDGVPRLDRWLVTYMGAEDTKLNRAFGRKWMIAAVRRARRPGCKFDFMLVLEGVDDQGKGKSTALAILAGGSENFSDTEFAHLRSREQQELLQGRWIIEMAELSGMQKADVEMLKAWLSRTHDRARGVWERVLEDQPRTFVPAGTTNDNVYLRDQTGNRRFWPVRTGEIDLDGLRRDRDQLWAEAAVIEATGEELAIPKELWAGAKVLQEERTIADVWIDALQKLTEEGGWGEDGRGAWFDLNVAKEEGEYRVTTADIFQKCLQIEPRHMVENHYVRLSRAMRKLGWDGPKVIRFKDRGPQRGYSKPVKRTRLKDL